MKKPFKNKADPLAPPDPGYRRYARARAIRVNRKTVVQVDQTVCDRPVFVLRLRPERQVDGVRALRRGLKALLRYHGLKAISVREERETLTDKPNGGRR